MNRNLIETWWLVALSLLLIVTSAHAQSGAEAYVPFAFDVGTVHMPAGTYEILKPEIDLDYVTVCNLKTGTTALSLFQTQSPSHVSHKLIFRHVGNRYFLAEIWGGTGTHGMTIQATKLQRQLQVARGPSSKNVEIALK
jgi:hypothetical protein